jgi:hypothetical protein
MTLTAIIHTKTAGIQFFRAGRIGSSSRPAMKMYTATGTTTTASATMSNSAYSSRTS